MTATPSASGTASHRRDRGSAAGERAVAQIAFVRRSVVLPVLRELPARQEPLQPRVLIGHGNFAW